MEGVITAWARWARRGAPTKLHAQRGVEIAMKVDVPVRTNFPPQSTRLSVLDKISGRTPSTEVTTLLRSYYLDLGKVMTASERREFESVLTLDDARLDECIVMGRHPTLLKEQLPPQLRHNHTFASFLQYARYHRGDGHERGGEYK